MEPEGSGPSFETPSHLNGPAIAAKMECANRENINLAEHERVTKMGSIYFPLMSKGEINKKRGRESRKGRVHRQGEQQCTTKTIMCEILKYFHQCKRGISLNKIVLMSKRRSPWSEI